MLQDSIKNALNKQINLEHYSSNLYLSAASWCISKGYNGAGTFLIFHAKEETMHMEKLFNYVLETGEHALIDSISKPKQDWNSFKEVFQDILDHERIVTRSINEVVSLCFDGKDFSSFNFLQWYVSEQHEEEALFMGIIDKFNLIGNEGRDLFFIDREISGLTGPGVQA